ncbi:antibiotic ABC transporter ATP-binding protein [Pseudofrankia sp. EUN1h]|nr:antibiotic ABC transporter ATP-binding protein [Pseudofrankia sp. EUN1h]
MRIAPGETYGLIGPNGAGKTTTISMIAGILAPDEGRIAVAGLPMTTRSAAAKALVGLVPQDVALYEDLTVRENLRFFGRLQQLPRRELAARIAEVLDVVGLADRAGDRVSECSGGMKRRANIAVGLLHEPRLLILDEPTVGVDPQSRNQILESIGALGVAGMSVLYTTHYMEEAERLCDRVGIIDDGRIVAEGTRRELIARIGEHDRINVAATGPLDRFAAAAAGLSGVVSADVVEGGLTVAAASAAAVLAPLVAAGERAGVAIGAVEVSEPDLETVFLHVTGKTLRD